MPDTRKERALDFIRTLLDDGGIGKARRDGGLVHSANLTLSEVLVGAGIGDPGSVIIVAAFDQAISVLREQWEAEQDDDDADDDADDVDRLAHSAMFARLMSPVAVAQGAEVAARAYSVADAMHAESKRRRQEARDRAGAK